MTTRLIERWLPIADIGEESSRERRSMTALPGIYFLHVWWARRPLIASRAAVLASILPADTAHEDFKQALGIHGNPAQVRARIDIAKRTKEDLGSNPYGYARAFQFHPAQSVAALCNDVAGLTVLDPTAGGGAIPLEAMRLGAQALANDLNPVAALIMRASIEYPSKFGHQLHEEFQRLSSDFLAKCSPKFDRVYPDEPGNARVDGYLWARTVVCPYCSGVIPLSPNWRLAADGTGVLLKPHLSGGPGSKDRYCSFEIVRSIAEQSDGTVAGGDAVCPYPDCARTVPGDEIKRQAGAGLMCEQLYAVVCRHQVVDLTKTGRKRLKWVRKYRPINLNDSSIESAIELLQSKLPEWEAFDIVPSELVPGGNKTDEPRRYGVNTWRDMFSPRQLLAHGLVVESFREMVEHDQAVGQLTSVRSAAYVYLAIAIDTLVNYGNRSSRWDSTSDRIRSIFDRHDFAFCWSYAEMACAKTGEGLNWALKKTSKALAELIDMVAAGERNDMLEMAEKPQGSISITNGSASSMPNVADQSVDVVVMDPPYGANVMYAELSDFFYVWLKRTAGLVVPELFTRRLADKETEAVANRAHFKGQKGAEKLANRDYQDKMAGIFAECRRVLKDEGIMTVMFTHKDTGAWDALAMSLMDAGFVITASWPVNTEASGSLHIKDKAAANSTIFLVCRPRREQSAEASYWEEVEPLVAKAVRERIDDFQISGIAGVDLYLASFGPALEAFSRHWPLTRGTPAPQPPAKRGAQGDLLEKFDPYAVRPEDALNAARREVKAWRLAQLADRRASRDMDPATAWVTLSWDAFRAPQFAFDEGLRLARAVGLDMAQVIGRLAEKKGSDLKLWDSATRLAKGVLGPPNGSRGMIDALHHAANIARKQSIEAARDHLHANGLLNDEEFKVALEVILEVLPPSKTFSGIDADAAVRPAADDFDALEKLRRIVYGDEIGAPRQLELYADPDAA